STAAGINAADTALGANPGSIIVTYPGSYCDTLVKLSNGHTLNFTAGLFQANIAGADSGVANVTWGVEGLGANITTVQACPASGKDVITDQNFLTFTGGANLFGVYHPVIKNLTIDGNATSPYGIRIYGQGDAPLGVIVQNTVTGSQWWERNGYYVPGLPFSDVALNTLQQDNVIKINYDNLFVSLIPFKEITTVPTSIGFGNFYDMQGTPGIHGAYGMYSVGFFSSLNGKLGVGVDFDTYFTDPSGANANLLPGLALSSTTFGTANWTTGVDGAQAVVVHDGSGVMTVAASFMAPGNFNLGGGTIGYDIGFYGLDQHALGTTLTAAFSAAPQTAPGYGFYSDSNNSDVMGNLTVRSLTQTTGAPILISSGINANGGITVTGIATVNTFIFKSSPTISSRF